MKTIQIIVAAVLSCIIILGGTINFKPEQRLTTQLYLESVIPYDIYHVRRKRYHHA